jgi:hypothetical protein
MSFPTSPINGQIAVVNNIAYEYATANSSWTRVLSIANIIQANVISANVLNVVQAFSIAGNIATANYFIGNGAFLTGLPVTYSNANVANYLPAYTGNLVSLTGPVTTTGNITANNVLFGTGVVSGTGTVYAATVSTTGNVNSGFLSTGEASVGNLFSGGYVSASGNVTGSYIFGNGALLTGVITSVSNINNGTSNVTVVSSGGNVTVGVGGTSNVAVFATTGEYVTGVVSASGNITGGNVISGGIRVYKWTTVANTAPSGAVPGDNWYDSYADKLYLYVNDGTGNAWVDQSPPTTFASLTVSGNTTSGNLLTAGLVSATGNITGGNLITGGLINATGNITGGNVNTNQVVGTGLTLVSTGDLTLSATGNINVNNEYINNVPTPVADGDAVNKLYVDNFVTGLNVHDAVTAATPTTLATITSGTITYYNGPGSNGVGATLSTTGTFNLIDTVNVQTAGTRILVLNEANAVTNGVYVWSNATAITRATDYNSVPEVEAGDFMFVTNGNAYGNTGWIQTSSISNVGFAGNNITFTQFSGSGTYNAGTGLTLTGTTFSVNASQTQITTVGTLGSLAVTGNITGGNVLGGANVNATTHTGTTVSVTANVTGGNILTGGLISATGTVTGSQFNGSGAGLTSIPGANVSGTVANATYATSAGSATTATSATSATTAGTVTTAAQPNITSVGTLSSLAVSSTITATGSGNDYNTGGVMLNGNGATNTVFPTLGFHQPGLYASSIQLRAGADFRFYAQGAGSFANITASFFVGTATTARYADLAELYSADAEYPPGTVVDFGGTCEITLSVESGSNRIAGVISTNPAHLMNSTLQSTHTAAVALSGRVPTLVVGPVRKGDMMVSAGNGHAQASATPAMGTVIGKAVEDFVGASGTIEIAVGRL